jgi:hypothetical protein
MNLNVKPPFFLTTAFFLTKARAGPLRAAAPAERPAKVINIASIDGIFVNPDEIYCYGASKAGTAVGGEADPRSDRGHGDRNRTIQIGHEPHRARPRR